MSETQPDLKSSSQTNTAAWRIRFVESPGGLTLLRTFVDPAQSYAVVEKLSAEIPIAPNPSELLVFWVPSESHAEGFAPAKGAVRVPMKSGHLFWQPGRAIVQSSARAEDSMLAALAQFAHDESHLRQLEEAVRKFERSALADAPLAYLPHGRNRDDWQRIIDSAKELALLRLRAARLEPTAYLPPPDFSPSERRLIQHLIEETDVEDRLEALSARLEACEDFYEGAVDRIVEQRGHGLERAIILLLMLETVFIIADLVFALARGH